MDSNTLKPNAKSIKGKTKALQSKKVLNLKCHGLSKTKVRKQLACQRPGTVSNR